MSWQRDAKVPASAATLMAEEWLPSFLSRSGRVCPLPLAVMPQVKAMRDKHTKGALGQWMGDSGSACCSSHSHLTPQLPSLHCPSGRNPHPRYIRACRVLCFSQSSLPLPKGTGALPPAIMGWIVSPWDSYAEALIPVSMYLEMGL